MRLVGQKKWELMLPFLRLVKVGGNSLVNNIVSAGTIIWRVSGYFLANVEKLCNSDPAPI